MNLIGCLDTRPAAILHQRHLVSDMTDESWPESAMKSFVFQTFNLCAASRCTNVELPYLFGHAGRKRLEKARCHEAVDLDRACHKPNDSRVASASACGGRALSTIPRFCWPTTHRKPGYGHRQEEIVASTAQQSFLVSNGARIALHATGDPSATGKIEKDETSGKLIAQRLKYRYNTDKEFCL